MIKTFIEPGEMSVLNRQTENKQHCYDSAIGSHCSGSETLPQFIVCELSLPWHP